MKIFKSDNKNITGEQAYYRALGMMILILNGDDQNKEIKADLKSAFEEFSPEFQDELRKTSPEFIKIIEQ